VRKRESAISGATTAFLLLALGLLLSSCSNPSDAASFSGGKISVERLQQSISTIIDERVKFNTTPQEGYSGAALTRNQLEFHIFTALLTEAAKERNVVARPGEIAARRADVLQSVGGEEQLSLALVNAGIASIDLDQYLSLLVLQEKLRPVIAPGATDDNQVFAELRKVLADTAAKMKLSVNPRYGSWNVETNRVEEIDPTGGALPKANN
jgi:hypothetical protein